MIELKMKAIKIYSTADQREFMNPTTYFNEELRETLMRIWMNRDFLNKHDLESLKTFMNKSFYENIDIIYPC